MTKIEIAAGVVARFAMTVDIEDMSDVDSAVMDEVRLLVSRYTAWFGELEFARACLAALRKEVMGGFDPDPMEIIADYFGVDTQTLLADDYQPSFSIIGGAE